MVQELVVSDRLTDEMITAGSELIAALDDARVPISGAFWLYQGDSEKWRLVVVSTRVKKYGPLKVYTDIERVLAQSAAPKKLFLSDIKVLETNARLFSSIRKAVGSEADVAGLRLTKRALDGQYIDDAYVYRLKKAR